MSSDDRPTGPPDPPDKPPRGWAGIPAIKRLPLRSADDPFAARVAELETERQRLALEADQAAQALAQAETDRAEAEAENAALKRALRASQQEIKVEVAKEEPPVRSRGPALLLQVGSVNWAGLRKVLVAVGVLGSIALSIITQLQKAERPKVDAINANTNALQAQVNGTSDAGADAATPAGEVPGLAAMVASGAAHDRAEDAARCKRDRWLQQVMAEQKPPVVFDVVGCPDAYDSVKVSPPILDPARGKTVRRVDRPLPAP
ncbi:MAG TPA: hypothetical protein VGP93_07945 [Polyangiaceae bacterium]|nr:hypothetical protein [Polyangiaceae bacterium]